MFSEAKDFKLLAIRPREKCDKSYCKNLKEELLYQFYDLFKFEMIGLQPFKITQTGHDHGLFNAYVHQDNKLKINISATVGQNGSGKSTLTELLFLCCYLVAIQNGILKIDESKKGDNERKKLEEIKAGLNVEMYYAIGEQYFCIVIDKKFTQPQTTEGNIQFIDLWKVESVPMAAFFYTIAINYSLYGLNEWITGEWVGRLFHKNDGYQTPVVINPFREKGNINIAGETEFAQTRLLSNLMLNLDKRVEILPGRMVTDLYFSIKRHKLERVEGYLISRIEKELKDATGKTAKEIFNLTYQALLGEPPNDSSIKDKNWRGFTINYVIGKLVRIANNYAEYRKYFARYSKEEVPGIKDIDRYINDLKDDYTHITLKLRQALNFYKYDPLRLGEEGLYQSGHRIYIPIDIFSERIKNIKEANPERDPMEFIPIAPFTPRLILENSISFHNLSSGEQQYINSVQSVIYHILNIESVFKSKNRSSKITYEYVNIILDEIELYFHPEFQRIFIKDLLQTLGKLAIPHIAGINIMFLTHSPFILSDIPAINVLRIKDGGIEHDRVPTFAGNIHQMLATSFFMRATTGEFARDQYQNILKLYEKVRNSTSDEIEKLAEKYREERERFRFIVSQIGEEVIKGVLENHLTFLDEKLFYDKATRDTQRQEIEAQIRLLNLKLNKLDDKD